MLFSMAKQSDSRQELKKIKAKVSKKCSYYISDKYISDSYSDSPLSSDSESDKIIQPAESNKINKLDHLVTNNIKKKINVMTS